MAASYASSSSLQLKASPKELLLVLSILNAEKKTKRKERDFQHQQHDQKVHEQKQLEEYKREGEQSQPQQRMELSQIELIYRAEGNANLVLALPQFKKVLRLPKISTSCKQVQPKQQTKYQETQHCQKSTPKHKPPQGHLKQQQEEFHQQEPEKTTGRQENEIDASGILTMDHYVAYISIIRCLVGNEFVFEADVVAVPNPTDRQWINEHIKPYRPANRLDKEFGGHFGLLLPDATHLPAEFDILFPNLQCKSQSAVATTVSKTSHCINISNSNSSSSSSNSSNADKSCSKSNNIFGSDTFAIEIKPKQGWLLPNDVHYLFDTKPKIIQTTQPPSLRETKTALKAAVATTMPTATEARAIKTSTDTPCCAPTQNEPSQTIVAATLSTTTTTTTARIPNVWTRSKTTSLTEVTKTAPCCSDSMLKTTTTQRDDRVSHSLYDKVDTRCRYCCMQFLKLKQEKISKRNQYCPIDLFSGSPERMIKAVEALFECPQNNLRIFKNGRLSFDDQISRSTKLQNLFSSDKLQLIKHLLVTCLLREYANKAKAKNEQKEQINKDSKQQQQPLSSTASTTDVGGVKGAECGEYKETDEEWDGSGADGQPHSSVTSCKKQKLLAMPKTTTATTSSYTEAEVTKVKSTLTSAEHIVSIDNILMSASDNRTRRLEQLSEAEMTCLPKNCVLQKILNLQSLAKIHFQFMLDHEYADKKKKTYNITCKLLEKFWKTHNDLTLYQLSAEEQYILAATALDCSIMITFCEIENVLEHKRQKVKESLIDSPYVVSIFGKTFLTKVTLLDLDPKSDAHFNKYWLQTKEIVAAIKES